MMITGNGCGRATPSFKLKSNCDAGSHVLTFKNGCLHVHMKIVIRSESLLDLNWRVFECFCFFEVGCIVDLLSKNRENSCTVINVFFKNARVR